jgi:energy-coupling factor transporter ATP-binding protein EcfA2
LRLSSIHFVRFRGLADYHLAVDDFNVLVGPNNSGKSTVVAALRLLAAAYQFARSKPPREIQFGERRRTGYWVPEQLLPITLENIHTELEPVDTELTFRFGSGRILTLWFPPDGGCCLRLDPTAPVVDSPAAFRRHYSFGISVAPVLASLEDDERLLAPEYVRRWAGTSRSSRHFRNHWWYNAEEFAEFRRLLLQTWPEVTDVSAPILPGSLPGRLVMFCVEEGHPREVQWAGFGFQIWCQVLTFLMHVEDADLVVIDEPEIFLHADVQRRLVHFLRELGPAVLVATHSAEIITEVEASDLIVVDKRRSSARRTSSPNRTRQALVSVGSNQNVVLSNLVRTRHVLFVEGEDYKILRRWARVLGLDALAAGNGLVTFPYGGFPTLEGLRELCRGIQAAVGDGEPLTYAGIFDRDYRADEDVDAIEEQLGKILSVAHILYRKEVENYLLVPAVLDRAMTTEVQRRRARGATVSDPIPAEDLLRNVSEDFREEVAALYVGARLQSQSTRGQTDGVSAADLSQEFARRWEALDVRLGLVPGKRVFSRFLDECQDRFGFSLSTTAVLQVFKTGDVNFEISSLLRDLEAFRRASA